VVGNEQGVATPQPGYSELPAYAARATWLHKLVIQQVDSNNRDQVVYRAVGPEDVPLLFRSDGIVIFGFDQSVSYRGGSVPPYIVPPDGHSPKETNQSIRERENLRDRRYRYMNAYMTCFNSAINITNPLPRASGPDYYIWAREDKGRWQLRDNGACELQKLPFINIIGVDQLQDSVSRFHGGRSEHYELRLDILDLVYRLSYHLNNHEFQTSLILCWIVIERCQNILWSDFVKGGYKHINQNSIIVGNRKKLLLTDRNFTASIKSQILALAGIYQDHELLQLDNVRRKRNAFMHGMEQVASTDAMFARTPVNILVEKALGTAIRMFGNPASWDYIA
jgi:hypothetical protein